jgi:hypothetical protein
VSKENWDTINERRCELIVKDVKRTITPEEAEELEGLQRLADERIRRLAPLPLEEMKAYLESIEKGE